MARIMKRKRGGKGLEKVLECNNVNIRPQLRDSGRLLEIGSASLLEPSIDHAAELVGVAALKPLQREAIRTFVQEKGVSPTVFIKSLCALLPAQQTAWL